MVKSLDGVCSQNYKGAKLKRAKSRIDASFTLENDHISHIIYKVIV